MSEKVKKDTFAALEERVKVLEEKQHTTEPMRGKEVNGIDKSCG